jgi:glycosyltransferase involved in cell wall biosynthesis
VVQDADLEYAPEEIPRLLAPLVRGEADVVYGTRYHAQAAAVGGPLHRAANRLLTAWSNRLTGLSLTDMETGQKAFRRSVLEAIEIEEERFGVEPELTAKLARHGCRFVETPVSYRPRSYAAGKKIGLRDGLRALWCVWRYARPAACERHGRPRRSTE